MIRHLLIGLVASMGFAPSAFAWWDEGHMQIAALAYDQLMPDIKTKADALIQLNPEYSEWACEFPASKLGQYAFIRAATWADDIKKPGSGYADDKPKGADQSKIGYAAKLQHKFWHYDDIAFSDDGTTTGVADPVNALTQIKALTQGLRPLSGEAPIDRSFDLVWLLHLVGDVHQPLHATSRFNQIVASGDHGDQGGNLVTVTPATGETIALHAYWDRLLGSYSTPDGAIYDAFIDKATKLPTPDATLAADGDPDHWLKASEQLVYAGPVKTGPLPYRLDRSYETAARDTARKQAALAGARLANLINDALK
jgi:hypothetical protein